MKTVRIVLCASLVLALTGCSVAPKYAKPAAELPETWSLTSGVQVKDARWWSVYGDPVLDELIEEALAHNSDVRLALARVDEARANLKYTAAQETPSAIIDSGASRSRTSQRTSQPLPAGSNTVSNSYRAVLDVSYEVDLWGRLRNATAAARADLLATEAARDTVRIALTSDVARGYFALRAFDGQITATRRSLASSVESLELQRRRLARGALSEYDFRQREAEVAQQRAQLPVFDRGRALQENALAVLLGRSPKAIYEGRMEAGQDPEGTSTAVAVPSGLPSELLLRRPDLIEAEQRLIAANARIGVARAYYFPAITLTGFLGSESTALGSLFTGPAGVWQFAVALSQPLWAGGRIDAAVEGATARREQTLAQYQGAIQNAFREVRDALVTQVTAREQLDAETQRVVALRETLRLARIRYDHGLASQIDVLIAERALLNAEQNRIDALRTQRAAIADLFKALGGGWN